MGIAISRVKDSIDDTIEANRIFETRLLNLTNSDLSIDREEQSAIVIVGANRKFRTQPKNPTDGIVND